MKKANITVLGSSNTDMIVQIQRIPGPGETLLGGKFSQAADGKGANQAVAAARAGASTRFIARLGADMLGDQALAGFVKDGIDVSQITRDPKVASGVALINVSTAGENAITVASGANAALTPAIMKKSAAAIKKAQCLVMQLETPLPTVAAAAQIAKKAGVKVILNPAPAQKLPPALLKNVDILTPNEHEARLLCGVAVTDEASSKKAAEALMKKGVGTVIITLGKEGAYVADKQTGLRRHLPTYPAKRVDSTAAGDVFNGALAVALAEGKDLVDAICFANAAASLSIMKLGAQPSIPCRKQIDAFLAKQKPLAPTKTAAKKTKPRKR